MHAHSSHYLEGRREGDGYGERRGEGRRGGGEGCHARGEQGVVRRRGRPNQHSHEPEGMNNEVRMELTGAELAATSGRLAGKGCRLRCPGWRRTHSRGKTNRRRAALVPLEPGARGVSGGLELDWHTAVAGLGEGERARGCCRWLAGPDRH